MVGKTSDAVEANSDHIEKEHHSAFDQLLSCGPCGTAFDIEARKDVPHPVCCSCGAVEKVSLFDIEEVSYVSGPNFNDIWMPPDRCDGRNLSMPIMRNRQ